MSSFEKLEVWQLAMNLIADVYKKTSELPKEELYGLTGQIRRAAVSIAANIAEGNGRNNRKEYIQFLGVASGSQAELATLLMATMRIYPNLDLIAELEDAHRIGMMLTRLKQALRTIPANRPPTTATRPPTTETRPPSPETRPPA
ncbi:MAG: four helix bundle protein [Armatimonadetes bacterium]|nr:four helix bundle protein [Armatimonadota bacterium]